MSDAKLTRDEIAECKNAAEISALKKMTTFGMRPSFAVSLCDMAIDALRAKDDLLRLADELDDCKLIVVRRGNFQEFNGCISVPSDLANRISSALRAKEGE